MSRFGAAPAKLLRKTALVVGDAEAGVLPVYTLTFSNPPAFQPGIWVRIAEGDTVKVCVPDCQWWRVFRSEPVLSPV